MGPERLPAPNTEVKGTEIGQNGNNINATNIKYTTLSVGRVQFRF